MKTITIFPEDFARTFTLIARYDTHYFIKHDIPEFLNSLSNTGYSRFRNFFRGLRSGEYIPKDSYSDVETNYVYLTIGQFSGTTVTFEGLTFLEESVGGKYVNIRVNPGDLVITRSGTVGIVHVFEPPDDKIYVPSHHLAIVKISSDQKQASDYFRLFLQGKFARSYFWAFATGKSQKEISNWSIKSIPIPQCEEPEKVAEKCKEIERRIETLEQEAEMMRQEKERVLYEAICGH